MNSFIYSVIGRSRKIQSETIKVAFKKGSVDAVIGDKCQRKFTGAVWTMTDTTNFGGNESIWICSNGGCFINKENNISLSYESPAGGDAIMLKLAPHAQRIHANTYKCATDSGAEFLYDVTVYGMISDIFLLISWSLK